MSDTDPASFEEWMNSPETYYTGIRSDVLDLLDTPPGQRILEIGGGEFETLRSLAGGNRELWGQDIRTPSAKLEHFVLGSTTDPTVSARLPDGIFDLVIANDVLEHVEDTHAFIRVVADKLKPGGKLLLSVPNARQVRLAYHVFVRGTFPRTTAGLFDETHLRWFCRRDVVQLFAQHGFAVEKSRSVGRMVPRALARTALGELLGLQNIFLFTRT